MLLYRYLLDNVRREGGGGAYIFQWARSQMQMDASSADTFTKRLTRRLKEGHGGGKMLIYLGLG